MIATLVRVGIANRPVGDSRIMSVGPQRVSEARFSFLRGRIPDRAEAAQRATARIWGKTSSAYMPDCFQLRPVRPARVIGSVVNPQIHWSVLEPRGQRHGPDVATVFV